METELHKHNDLNTHTKTYRDTSFCSLTPIISDTENDRSSRSEKRQVSELDTNSNEGMSSGTDMNPEEKAKANRDRNREHSRNTRLRRKAYVEKLVTTVDGLCRERDTLLLERLDKANHLTEIHNTRIHVLQKFFALRTSNESRRHLWSYILDESSFQCILPITPYRSFPASEVQVSKSQRTILGIDGMISDTASLHVLFGSLVNRSLFPTGQIKFRYELMSDDAVVSDNQIMMSWSMTTLNAVENGAHIEVSKQGMISCTFSSAHTIVGLKFMFDVMAFMLQLKESKRDESFPIIPNTIQTCQRPYKEPMIVIIAQPPYTIVQVNRLWENMSGYSANEVIGKISPRILQGKETNPKTVQEIKMALRHRRPCQVSLLNYRKNGTKFENFISLHPLSTDSKITHYLELSHYVNLLEEEEDNKKNAETKAFEAEQHQRERSISTTSFTMSSITSKSSNSI